MPSCILCGKDTKDKFSLCAECVNQITEDVEEATYNESVDYDLEEGGSK